MARVNHIIATLTRCQIRRRATLLFQWRNLGRFNEFPSDIDRVLIQRRTSRSDGAFCDRWRVYFDRFIYLFIFPQKSHQSALSSSSTPVRNGCRNIQGSDEPRFSIPVIIVGNTIYQHTFIYLFQHWCVSWDSILPNAQLPGYGSQLHSG